jgi:hypothetical protein
MASKINSRAKGIRLERELCALLTEGLGRKVTRNWQAQSAVGGHDLEGLDHFAPESKGDMSMSPQACWRQTLQQARDTGRIPVLFRKVPLLPWDVYVPIAAVEDCGGWAAPPAGARTAEYLSWIYCEFDDTVRMSMGAFCRWALRSGLVTPEEKKTDQ